jgi:hypothetical protein
MDCQQALEWFDQLAPVDIDFMLGPWLGQGVNTGHPMDGMLERANWIGKTFDSEERVFPLVHATPSGARFTAQPALMPMGLLLRYPGLQRYISPHLFSALRWVFATRRPGARLRMTTYRGKASATMIYNRQPINDVFRKIDNDTVLGLMDMVGMEQPFFFTLSRAQHQ